MSHGTANFVDLAAAERSPLATRIFGVEGVTGVFFGSDFITVTKGAVDWNDIKPAVLGSIMDHFTSGDPIVLASAESSDDAEDDDGVVMQIKELLETRVRPAVAQDGGDIIFHGFEDGIVHLEMHGACAGCPSSTMTLKHGIENMLRHYIPEVMEVRQI